MLSMLMAISCYRRTEQLVVEMAVPEEGSQPLHFASQHAHGPLAQYRTLLWKDSRVYWRSPGAPMILGTSPKVKQKELILQHR